MNTKKDGPGKDGAKPAETPGVKKPYATLDLKATEIKTESKDAKPAADVKPVSYTHLTLPRPAIG